VNISTGRTLACLQLYTRDLLFMVPFSVYGSQEKENYGYNTGPPGRIFLPCFSPASFPICAAVPDPKTILSGAFTENALP
jgi:hypothetical protein